MTPHPELQDLRGRLRDIYVAMATFGSAQLAAKPPILDLSMDLSGDSSEEFHSRQDAIQGLRALRDAVRRDLDVLDKVSSSWARIHELGVLSRKITASSSSTTRRARPLPLCPQTRPT